MQTSPGIAEPLDQQTLDEDVNVLVRPVDEAGVRSPPLEDLAERGFDLTGLVESEDSGLRQRPRPGDATGHVVFEETAIESKRGAELEGRLVGRHVESAGPQRAHEGVVRASANASAAG